MVCLTQHKSLAPAETAGGAEIQTVDSTGNEELFCKGHENVIGIFGDEVFKQGEGNLRRKAHRGDQTVYGRRYGLVRGDDGAAEMREEVIVKGIEFLSEKGGVKAYRWCAGFYRPLRGVFIEHQVITNLDVIPGLFSYIFLVSEIVVAVARSTKGIDLAVEAKPDDGTFQIAPFFAAGTYECFAVCYFTFYECLQVKTFLFHDTQLDSLLQLQGHSKGAHQPGLGRHHDVLVQNGSHGQGDGPVVADSPLHEHFFAHRPGPLYPVDKVETDRVDETGQNVVLREALVSCILDIR